MKDLLKFITCGSVDDGKSTLIGHLLYSSKQLYADQLRMLELDSKLGSNDGQIDYSLLLDGLIAEREQGITIDAAYRYFSTKERSFIVADCPGHEQYTRNMAVGASFADVALLLVDASKGILTQTKRHARICAFMGIESLILAVNKMDLVDFKQDIFDKIKTDFNDLCTSLDISSIAVIPLSATQGDNVTELSDNMPWYKGKSLLAELESFNVQVKQGKPPFVMCVQRSCRPSNTFRGFMGEIDSGHIKIGDAIKVLPEGNAAKVSGIIVAGENVHAAYAGEPVNISLDREIDVSRGSVFFKGKDDELSPEVSNYFQVRLIWTDDTEWTIGSSFFLKCGTKVVPASIKRVKSKVDIETGELSAANTIQKNDIVHCEIVTSENIVFSPFKDNKTLGGFILIDRITNQTSACGVIESAVNNSGNVTWQNTDVTRELRSNLLGQKPVTLWFTGLSGSGKSTIANAVEKRLASMGRHTMLLDGDNMRFGLNKDLGFDQAARVENIRRIAEVAKLLNDAGLIVLTAFISPFTADRENARDIVGTGSFIEIYVNTPLETCEVRDTKGLYKKARAGLLSEFTGISSAYEPPQNPNGTIDTSSCSVDEAVEIVIRILQSAAL